MFAKSMQFNILFIEMVYSWIWKLDKFFCFCHWSTCDNSKYDSCFNQQNSMKKFVTSIQLNVNSSPLINKPTFPSNLLQETKHDHRSGSGNPIDVQQRLNEEQKVR